MPDDPKPFVPMTLEDLWAIEETNSPNTGRRGPRTLAGTLPNPVEDDTDISALWYCPTCHVAYFLPPNIGGIRICKTQICLLAFCNGTRTNIELLPVPKEKIKDIKL